MNPPMSVDLRDENGEMISVSNADADIEIYFDHNKEMIGTEDVITLGDDVSMGRMSFQLDKPGAPGVQVNNIQL